MDDMKINDLQARLNTLVKNYPSVPIKQTVEKNNEIVEMDFDPDSSPKAWEYYLIHYKDLFQKQEELNTYLKPLFSDDKTTVAFWIQKPKAKYKRICGTFNYTNPNNKLELTSSPLKVKKNIGFAGDCCFNFNTNKKNKLNSIINKDNTVKIKKSLLTEILQSCYLMHYSPLNFALMPINGGMNNIKGDGRIHGLDRFDILISSLNLYYRTKHIHPTAIKIIAEFEGSYNSLVPFLNSIGSFKSYCDFFYPELTSKSTKDKKLLNALIKSGQKPIDSTERVIEYIELAIRFWEAKADYYEEQTKDIK